MSVHEQKAIELNSLVVPNTKDTSSAFFSFSFLRLATAGRMSNDQVVIIGL